MSASVKKAEEKGFADAMEGSLSSNPKNLSLA